MNADQFKSPPVEITEARFTEMLEVLPPMNWRGGAGRQSFMISEFTYADITAIFCQIGERYFELADSAFISHEQIVARCEALEAQ